MGRVETRQGGSRVRMTSVTDSLNRQVTINYYASGGAYQEITYKGFGGAMRSLKVYFAQLSTVLRSDFTLLTAGQMFPELNGAGGGFHNPFVVSAVELPNGKQYQFRYDSYAELTRVILLPEGAPMATSARATLNFRRLQTKVNIEITLTTPQPAQSLPNRFDYLQGNVKVVKPEEKKQ